MPESPKSHLADFVRELEDTQQLEDFIVQGASAFIDQQQDLSLLLEDLADMDSEGFKVPTDVVREYIYSGAGFVYSLLLKVADGKPLPIVRSEGMQSMTEEIKLDPVTLISICKERDENLASIIIETYDRACARGGQFIGLDFSQPVSICFLQGCLWTQFYLFEQFEKDQFRAQMGG